MKTHQPFTSSDVNLTKSGNWIKLRTWISHKFKIHEIPARQPATWCLGNGPKARHQKELALLRWQLKWSNFWRTTYLIWFAHVHTFPDVMSRAFVFFNSCPNISPFISFHFPYVMSFSFVLSSKIVTIRKQVGMVYLPLHVRQKSTIHVGKYTRFHGSYTALGLYVNIHILAPHSVASLLSVPPRIDRWSNVRRVGAKRLMCNHFPNGKKLPGFTSGSSKYVECQPLVGFLGDKELILCSRKIQVYFNYCLRWSLC